LSPDVHAGGFQNPSDDVIPDARKVLHTPSPDEHNRVLLKVVPLTGDVGIHLNTVGKPNPGYFSQGGVRFLGGQRPHTGADPPFLRACLESRDLVLPPLPAAPMPHELVDCGHRLAVSHVSLVLRIKKSFPPPEGVGKPFRWHSIPLSLRGRDCEFYMFEYPLSRVCGKLVKNLPGSGN